MKNHVWLILVSLVVVLLSPVVVGGPIQSANTDGLMMYIIEDIKFMILGQPEQTFRVDSMYINIALVEEFGYDVPIHVSDSLYKTVTKEEMQNFLDVDVTDRILSGFWDCDDVAFRFQGKVAQYWSWVPVGIVLTDVHACNVFVDNNLDVWFINANHDMISVPDVDNSSISVVII